MPDNFYDLWVAGGLVVISLILFFLNRIGLLPRKTLPFVAGALLGGLGLILFRAGRRRGDAEAIKRMDAEVERRQAELDRIRDECGVAEKEFAAARARLNNQNAALKAENQELAEKQKAKEKVWNDLSGPALHDALDRADWSIVR